MAEGFSGAPTLVLDGEGTLNVAFLAAGGKGTGADGGMYGRVLAFFVVAHFY